MKAITQILTLFTIIIFTGCSIDDEPLVTKDQEQSELNKKYTEITSMANKVECTDASAWKFTSIGSNPCGGPTRYIAYPSAIDTVSFLQKVSAYTAAQSRFNTKWRIVSDCSTLPSPQGVICVDGKPEFVY